MSCLMHSSSLHKQMFQFVLKDLSRYKRICKYLVVVTDFICLKKSGSVCGNTPAQIGSQSFILKYESTDDQFNPNMLVAAAVRKF